MELQNTLIPLATSLIIGALIGMEREKNKQKSNGMSAVGIRTDILISLFGAISAFLGRQVNPWIYLLCLASIITITAISYFNLVNKGRIGITTEVSTIIVFLLGSMAMVGYEQVAVILAIITTFILSIRNFIHNAVKNIHYHELFDTIKFAIIAFVILPILPNTSFDNQIFDNILPHSPYQAQINSIQVINPYTIWLLVVIISGISFLGYILVKYIGKGKGIPFSGLLGGLYSSSATSLTLAKQSKEMPQTITPFLSGIVLACGISFTKTIVLVRTLNSDLAGKIMIPLGIMLVYLLSAGAYLMLKSSKEKTDNKSNFETPFKLRSAIQLGAIILSALLIAKITLAYAGINMYYIISAAMAFFAIDDPVIISASSSIGQLMTLNQAKNLILVVTYLNMAQKIATVYFFGNKKLVRPLAIIFFGLLLVTLAGIIYF